MARRSWVIWCIVVASVLTVAFQSMPQTQQSDYYLTGNLKGVGGSVTTDKGRQETTFSGAIGFRVIPGKGGLTISLIKFDLVAKGVPTASGDSGVIGLLLAEPEYKGGTYDPRTGQFTVEFQSTLHYGLIDQKKGYLPRGPRGEADLFASYTVENGGEAHWEASSEPSASGEGQHQV